MALTGEIKVKDGINTSSLLFTPANNKEMCKAEVPFTHATAYLDLVYSLISTYVNRLIWN